MTARLLEAVPNFSEGRDVETVGATGIPGNFGLFH
jgi:glutamate formiminotransferase